MILYYFANLIPHSKTRKKVRRNIKNFSIIGYVKNFIIAFKILRSKSTKRIALLELNRFHCECLYSIHSYLKSLDKEITIFTTKENKKLGIFSDEKIITITPEIIKILDRFKYFNDFDFIFVGSYFIDKSEKTAEQFFPNYLKTNKKFLVIDHAPGLLTSEKSNFANVKKFVLAEFLSKKYNLPYIYTSIFPEFKKFNRDYKKFISIGVIGRQTKRDMDSYINVIKKHKNIFSYLIASYIKKTYKPILNSLPNIEYHKKASFQKMFELCQKSTFLPFLIPINITDYFQRAISGSLNLSLGFQLIPIIDESTAKLYKFNSNNAIIYKENLEEAMLKALSLDEKEIKKMQNSLLEMNNILKQKSQINLENVINDSM